MNGDAQFTFCRVEKDESDNGINNEVSIGRMLFSKYVFPLEEPESDTYAWFYRCKLNTWQNMVHVLGLLKPIEGGTWIRLKVKSMETKYEVDGGATMSRRTHLLDKHEEIATYVGPFVNLYQVW